MNIFVSKSRDLSHTLSVWGLYWKSDLNGKIGSVETRWEERRKRRIV
jgi:hypothetical protein